MTHATLTFNADIVLHIFIRDVSRREIARGEKSQKRHKIGHCSVNLLIRSQVYAQSHRNSSRF